MSEEFEKLDSPLVVHKETDASFLESANIDAIAASSQQVEDTASNLVRHRFKKVKKRKKSPWIILIIVIIIAVICGLYFSGIIGNRPEQETENTTKNSYVEVTENKFEGVITVKGTYIFFEGEEVSGTEDLERQIKYLDNSTSFVVQDEEADSVFLNDEILPLLDKYGFKYECKYILSSGLKSQYETTANSTKTKPAENSSDAE